MEEEVNELMEQLIPVVQVVVGVVLAWALRTGFKLLKGFVLKTENEWDDAFLAPVEKALRDFGNSVGLAVKVEKKTK